MQDSKRVVFQPIGAKNLWRKSRKMIIGEKLHLRISIVGRPPIDAMFVVSRAPFGLQALKKEGELTEEYEDHSYFLQEGEDPVILCVYGDSKREPGLFVRDLKNSWFAKPTVEFSQV